MANRYPLIVDKNAQRIQELVSGDNLDLTGNGISAVQDITPENDVQHNLGSSSKRWDELHVGGPAAFTSTGAIVLPVGDTAQRPDPATIGMFRFNTDINKFEGYNGIEWVEIQAGFTFEGDLDTLSGTEDLEEGSGTVDLMT